MPHPPFELTSPDFVITELITLHEALYQLVRRLGPEMFLLRDIRSPGGTIKPVTELIAMAEHLWAIRMNQRLGAGRVRVLGHSTLSETISLSNARQSCVFLDIIDDIRAYRDQKPGWTSSVLVYEPSSRQIVSAFLARASDMPPMLYFTTHDPGAFKMKFTNLFSPNLPVALQVTRNSVSLASARIAVHGDLPTFAPQKASGTFNISASDLAEGNLDAVLQMEERLPHTVLPGVAIAAEAGASVGDESSASLQLAGFLLSLLRPGIPASRCVLTVSPELLASVAMLISSQG